MADLMELIILVHKKELMVLVVEEEVHKQVQREQKEVVV